MLSEGCVPTLPSAQFSLRSGRASVWLGDSDIQHLWVLTSAGATGPSRAGTVTSAPGWGLAWLPVVWEPGRGGAREFPRITSLSCGLQAWRLLGWRPPGPCLAAPGAVGVLPSRSGLQPPPASHPGADLCLLWHLRVFLGLCRQTGLVSLASPPGHVSVSFLWAAVSVISAASALRLSRTC